MKVLHRLNKQGYDAYLVGGCVRDLLLNRTPKDFDITTNATPEQIQKIFRNCRLVGRRFRLAHIMFGREIIEVATFRGEQSDNDNSSSQNANNLKHSQSGMLLRDNVYGTLEQDAMRRDFTINCLYYNVKDFTIRDYCGGIDDLKKGIIRLIGDPSTRYREDPVRMLRAVRFAAKLEMSIAPQTAAPIKKLGQLLKNIPGPRLFDESLKLLQSGHGYHTYLLLREYRLFELLFPTLGKYQTDHQPVTSSRYLSNMEKMIEQVLKNTDYRIANDQRVNPAFLFAVFFWYPLIEHTQEVVIESGLNYQDAFALAGNNILNEQCAVISIPKRLTAIMSEIWRLQLRLNKRNGKRPYAVFEHQKFRAAYDLLELRSSIEKGELLELAKWWDEFQHTTPDAREAMIKQVMSPTKTRQHRHTTKKKQYHSASQKKISVDD